MSILSLRKLGSPKASVGGVVEPMADPIMVPRELFEQFVDEDDTIRANFDALRADYRLLRKEYEILQGANKALREEKARAVEESSRAIEVARLADHAADMAKRMAEAEIAKRVAEAAEGAQKKVEDSVFHLLPVLDDVWYAINSTKDAALVNNLSLKGEALSLA